MTPKDALEIARQFVRNEVHGNRQWDTLTLASYLDTHQWLRTGADYSGPATIGSIAAFLRAEVRECAR